MKTTSLKRGVAAATFAATLLSGMPGLAATLDRQSQDLAQERIQREEAAQAAKVRGIDEALSAVQETRASLADIQKNDKVQARQALTRALGKLDLALSSHSDLNLLPLSADIRVIDTNASDATIKLVSETGKKLVRQNRFQAARMLFRQLVSEMDIVTVNIPVATYPPSIRAAARQLDQNDLDAAKAQLLSALQGLTVVETIIPLPVIRAQALVDEVGRQISSKELDRARANTLLTEADDQLAAAEKLGYGSRSEDFRMLHSEIAQARHSVNKNEESSGLVAKIKSGLESLRAKFSRSPASSDKSNED